MGSLLNHPKYSLLFYTVSALSVKLKEALNLPSVPKLVHTTGTRELLTEPPVAMQYPIMFLKLGSVSISDTSGRGNKFSQGVLTEYSAEGYDAVKISVLPVKMDLTLHVCLQDTEALLRFISDWMLAAMKHRTSFVMTYRGTDFAISANLQESLDVPEREDYITTADSPHHELTGTIEFFTYLSSEGPLDATLVPLIRDLHTPVTPAPPAKDKDKDISPRSLFKTFNHPDT